MNLTELRKLAEAATYTCIHRRDILALLDLVDEMAEALEEAVSVREGLINWRQKAWPGIDQRLVIDRDYPHIVTALAKHKELTNEHP